MADGAPGEIRTPDRLVRSHMVPHAGCRQALITVFPVLFTIRLS